MGTRQYELAWLAVFVHEDLYFGKERRNALYFVDDHRRGKGLEKGGRVPIGEGSQVAAFQIGISMRRKRKPGQRGFSGLAWAQDGHHGKVSGLFE